MRNILVIRFGALGDLCLTGWTLSRLATADVRVTLVTKAQLGDLAQHFAGVDEVITLPAAGTTKDLLHLAATLRGRSWDLVLDAHRVLRSRLLTLLLGCRPDAILHKDTVARLKLLQGGPVDPALQRHMRHRLDALLSDAGLPSGDESPPLSSLAADLPRLAILGLAPGAQWDTKRWPAQHWATLAHRFQTEHGGPVRVYLGPREATWFPGSELESALATLDQLEIVQDRSLVDVARSLGQCRLLVCNDSGLMHLAEAVNTPVTAFFGPTVAAFGYSPQLPGSVVLENNDLDCRPCSRNGKRSCHRQDLACLDLIDPVRAWDAIQAHGPWKDD